MTYTDRGVTLHTMDPIDLRTAKRWIRYINLPAPKSCWLV